MSGARAAFDREMQWFHTLGPNGMSGARAAFERKYIGTLLKIPQDRMVP